MDIVRRNTDYALRAMVNLAQNYGNSASSTRDIAAEEDISYQLACKLMQKLHNAKLVKSCMGPKGGFRLNKKPSRISLLEVIEAIQGSIQLSRCLLGDDICPHQKSCKVRTKLAELERFINSYLGSVTLEKIVRQKEPKVRRPRTKGRKNERQRT